MGGGVLITGGAGLLALNWAGVLRGHRRVTLGLHERSVALAGVESGTVNLDTADAFGRALDAAAPEIVVHTAGLANVERCEENPRLAEEVNVRLAANVAAACARRSVPLIHVSTDQLFSGETALVAEGEAPNPVNTYGRTKAEAERRVLDAHPDALVVRTNFYAWGPRYRRSFSDTIIDALRAGTPVTLFADVFFTPILVEPLARAAHDLLERGTRGIVHVGGDDRLSKHAFGLRIAERFGLDAALIRPGRLEDHPGLVRRPLDMSLSNRLACGVLERALGGVDAHLEQLQDQERRGWASEMPLP